MEIKFKLEECKSENLKEVIAECLYCNEHIFIKEKNAIINTGADLDEDYIYTIVPSSAFVITITNNHSDCSSDYPYAVLFSIENAYGIVSVQSNFIDVITADLAKEVM